MKLWTVKDVAEYLALSERTVYKMVREDALPAIKIGGVYRFDGKEIEDWAKTPKSPAEDEDPLARIKSEADQLTKRLLFIGLLTRKLKDQKIKPVIVGGNAVEFYTAGGYATGDIDIVCPSEPLDPILKELGLSKEGRHWYSDELDIVIEAPAAFLDARTKKRIIEVDIDDMKVFLIGIEDLIVDRLNAFVHWKSTEDRNWAKELISYHQDDVDWKYLGSSAKMNKVDSALTDLKKELGIKT